MRPRAPRALKRHAGAQLSTVGVLTAGTRAPRGAGRRPFGPLAGAELAKALRGRSAALATGRGGHGRAGTGAGAAPLSGVAAGCAASGASEASIRGVWYTARPKSAESAGWKNELVPGPPPGLPSSEPLPPRFSCPGESPSRMALARGRSAALPAGRGFRRRRRLVAVALEDVVVAGAGAAVDAAGVGRAVGAGAHDPIGFAAERAAGVHAPASAPSARSKTSRGSAGIGSEILQSASGLDAAARPMALGSRPSGGRGGGGSACGVPPPAERHSSALGASPEAARRSELLSSWLCVRPRHDADCSDSVLRLPDATRDVPGADVLKAEPPVWAPARAESAKVAASTQQSRVASGPERRASSASAALGPRRSRRCGARGVGTAASPRSRRASRNADVTCNGPSAGGSVRRLGRACVHTRALAIGAVSTGGRPHTLRQGRAPACRETKHGFAGNAGAAITAKGPV